MVLPKHVLCILRQQLIFCSSLLSGLTSARRQSREPSNAQGISIAQTYAQGQHSMSLRGYFFTGVSPCVFSCSDEAAEGCPVCCSTPDTCWTECMKLCCLLILFISFNTPCKKYSKAAEEAGLQQDCCPAEYTKVVTGVVQRCYEMRAC